MSLATSMLEEYAALISETLFHKLLNIRLTARGYSDIKASINKILSVERFTVGIAFAFFIFICNKFCYEYNRENALYTGQFILLAVNYALMGYTTILLMRPFVCYDTISSLYYVIQTLHRLGTACRDAARIAIVDKEVNALKPSTEGQDNIKEISVFIAYRKAFSYLCKGLGIQLIETLLKYTVHLFYTSQASQLYNIFGVYTIASIVSSVIAFYMLRDYPSFQTIHAKPTDAAGGYQPWYTDITKIPTLLAFLLGFSTFKLFGGLKRSLSLTLISVYQDRLSEASSIFLSPLALRKYIYYICAAVAFVKSIAESYLPNSVFIWIAGLIIPYWFLTIENPTFLFDRPLELLASGSVAINLYSAFSISNVRYMVSYLLKDPRDIYSFVTFLDGFGYLCLALGHPFLEIIYRLPHPYITISAISLGGCFIFQLLAWQAQKLS